MIRAIRFASQLNFKIEEKSFLSIKKNQERLKIISNERIIEEFNKILLSKKPSIGIKLLFDTKLLTIFFAELVNLEGNKYAYPEVRMQKNLLKINLPSTHNEKTGNSLLHV